MKILILLLILFVQDVKQYGLYNKIGYRKELVGTLSINKDIMYIKLEDYPTENFIVTCLEIRSNITIYCIENEKGRGTVAIDSYTIRINVIMNKHHINLKFYKNYENRSKQGYR